MNTFLRILHLEENPADTDLVKAVLEDEQITCSLTRVSTRSAFLAALEKSPYELILADYALPSFDGLSALALAAEKAPGCPFVFFSGTLDEQVLVEALKQGAGDFVFKDRPARLPVAMRRALREAAEAAERHRAVEAERPGQQGPDRQARRMEVIGRLAGDIAHEFNNLLTVIQGNAELLAMTPSLVGPEGQNLLKRIIAAAQRAGALSRQLLAFSRKQPIQTRPLDLNEAIGSLTSIFKRVAGEDIRVEVSTQPGAGTRVTILLPRLEDSSAPADSLPQDPPASGGTERILLVEDDLGVRATTRRALESLGYHVLESGTGREALEIWAGCGAKVDLLLTDVALADALTGYDLAGQLRAQQSGLKVIFISDSADKLNGKTEELSRQTGNGFLHKPCSTPDLLRLVRRCLDQKS